ncbi:BN860_06084g1_1 [Zygosaccharomyces bailii CLIB 213]|uniref:BN860_06084g1_1 n=1 Tax=Zygosaccharomyces bailii (strain CLIB 213 / ATCC 58445 / CBS 680 / BCRC 21525 / NBRC 1098 / NCYC 1416 / NRRL Y-2227) TaxID=1333698 RepID=A0A8J2X6A1_ZYGB2|nr:BN860_06084g1_1 [Zygosaccharomyces bailii CLIB 213]
MFNETDCGNKTVEEEIRPLPSSTATNYLSPASLDSGFVLAGSVKFTPDIFSKEASAPALIDSAEPTPTDSKLMTTSDDIKTDSYSSNNSTDEQKTTGKPNSTVTDTKGSVVKRKYSRNGCTECKRRRMKCDETKPTCWQCARLNRECIYILNAKNKKRKPKDPNSKKVKRTGGDNKREGAVSSTKLNENADKDVIGAMQVLELPNVIAASNMDGYDANLLIQNLNDMVSMKLNDSFLLNEELKDFQLPDLDIPELMPQSKAPVSTVPISFLVNNVITFNTKLSSFNLGGVHDKYLEVFFYDCLDSIAPFFQNQGNPLRDIILSFARNESYLLSATLAVGASIAHRSSNKLEDEKNYCAYLSHCLSLLSEQFQNESNVVNKIEPITLTVIMLAWDCINAMNSQWRSHLKGVTDLFKKINSGNSSKVMNVAKCWFKVMETFASISTVLGGSLTDEQDLDLIFNPVDYQYVDSLKFLNIMTPLNEFNLLRGHKEDFDLVIKEVIKGLNAIRFSGKDHTQSEEEIFPPKLDYLHRSSNVDIDKSLSYFKTQKILVEIDKQLDYEFIDRSGIIPPDSRSHPDNSHIDDNAIDIVTLRSGERIAISWYDISHQTQVLSILLIVLLKLFGMPKESIAVQQVVKKVMSFFKFLDSDEAPRNSRTCYSNFAVLIAGLNAMDEDTRNVVRAYYKLNGGKFRRLTEHNLNRLEKVWNGKDGDYRLADEDVLTW